MAPVLRFRPGHAFEPFVEQSVAAAVDDQVWHLCDRAGQSAAFLRSKSGWRRVLSYARPAVVGGRCGRSPERTDGWRTGGGSAKGRPCEGRLAIGPSADRPDAGRRPAGAGPVAVAWSGRTKN